MRCRSLISTTIVFSIFVWSLGIPGAGQTEVQSALALNKQGEKLLEQAKYSEAIDVFSKMLDECGANQVCTGVAKFYMGRSQFEIAQYDTALKFLDEAEQIFAKLNRHNQRAMVLVNRGKVLAGQGDYRSALKEFSAAEKVFTEVKNNKELIPVFNSVAVVHAYLSDYDQALQYLDSAEKLIRGSTDTRLLGALNNNRGLVLSKRQDYSDAMRYYELALQHYQSNGDLKGVCIVLNNMGNVSESKSEYLAALNKHNESLKLARQIQDPWSESLALNNIGCVELKRGNFKAALDAHEKALEIRQRLGVKHFAAETLNNIGLVALAYADYPRASECFQESRNACRAVGSLSGEAWALHNCAFLFKDQGKFKESLTSSEDAVNIARKIGDRRLESTAILRLGNLYEYQGLFDKALDQFVKAAEIQKEISDWNFRSNTLMDIAGILTRQGEAADAEDFYQEALKLKGKIGAPVGELLCKLAIFHMEKHRYMKGTAQNSEKSETHESREKAKGAIEAAEQEIKPDQKNDLMLLRYVKARYLLDKDAKESILRFNQLKSQAEAAGSRRFSFLAAVGLGLAHEALKDWGEAQKAFKQAVEYAENIRKTLDPEARLTFLDGEEILGVKHVVPYEGLARVLMRKGEKEQSFTWAEYTKARAFSESLSRRLESTSFNIPQAILDTDVDLDAKIAALTKGVDKAYEQGAIDAVKALQKELDELSVKKQKYLVQLRQDFPLFAATKYPEPVPLDQTALASDERVIAYEVTDSGILLYLMQGKKLLKGLFKPFSRSKLDELVRKFREPLDIVPGRDDAIEKLKSFDFESGRKLSKLLLGDILSDLPAAVPVVIVPDDSLGVLPFEMLVLNNTGKIDLDGEVPRVSGAEFFGDRNPISYYQSATALSLVRTLGEKKKPPERLLVLADPVFQYLDARAEPVKEIRLASADQNFSTALMNAVEGAGGGSFKFNRLPLTGELAEGLSDMFEGKSDLFTGLKANKERFIKDLGPQLEQYGKIVFGTHGFFSKDNPHFKEPILVLSLVPRGTDGFLRMSEVMGLRLNSDIVALTACQSGLGEHISGEGTMGMGRAFQYAGARSVLISLWSVSEASSVSMVESFFKHIKNGNSKLSALKLARKEIRDEGYDHPFFWAAFILVGELN